MEERIQSPTEIDSIHKRKPEEVFRVLNTRPDGLTSSEAESVQKQCGKNVIREKKQKSVFVVFLKNFISMMAILLWIGGIIAFVAQMPELGIAIWLVNVINGVFSFWQEFRASKATEALKKMLSSFVRVIRDGQEQQIPAEDLVPGDIMILSEGDKISADVKTHNQQ